MRWRWQQEQYPRDPWTNMMVDETALNRLLDRRELDPIIRVYQWDRSAVSIGRLQNEEAARIHYPDLPLVRRPTGGRAVLHGQDLTISVAARRCCLPDHGSSSILPSYHRIMQGLTRALSDCGVPTAYAAACPSRKSAGSVNCFDIANECDLVDRRTGTKIVGSAQRREKDVILQQMTFPLALLPDLSFFSHRLQEGFQNALRITDWIIN